MASLTFENPKDPKDLAPYSFNFVQHCIDSDTGERFDTVEDAVVVVLGTAGELTVISSGVVGDHVVAMIGGGVLGQKYVVECEATFESGKVLNRSATLKMKDL